jgi:hypothetical protein
MPTSTKKNKSKPGRKPKHKNDGGLRSAIAGLASNLRPTRKSTPARKPSNKRRRRVAAGAGIRTRPLKPSRKGLVGIAAGAGLGGVAMAKRRRGRQSQATSWPPGEAPDPAMQDVSAAARPHDANDPNDREENGDPKGPGFADAA